jgi:hypothetical protein
VLEVIRPSVAKSLAFVAGCFEVNGAEAALTPFLNRDHIISVTIHGGEIVVLTTASTEITIPASPATLEKFVDDLSNHVESNFVSIASAPVT